MIKDYLIKEFPELGKYKRLSLAYRDKLLNKVSYSQFNEDIFILDLLQKSKIKKSHSLYLDIGANHPTVLSNTYLLYKHGYRGILVEPNPELASLLEKFRKKDVILRIGASNRAELLKFNISKTPVVSTFNTNPDQDIWKSIYVPVFPASVFMQPFNYEIISFLSIDVEGLNLQVLEGALEILDKVFLLCIEFDDASERAQMISKLKEKSFELRKEVGCNLIFMNTRLTNLFL